MPFVQDSYHTTRMKAQEVYDYTRPARKRCISTAPDPPGIRSGELARASGLCYCCYPGCNDWSWHTTNILLFERVVSLSYEYRVAPPAGRLKKISRKKKKNALQTNDMRCPAVPLCAAS